MEGHFKQREKPGWRHRSLEQPEAFGDLHVAHTRKRQDMTLNKEKTKQNKTKKAEFMKKLAYPIRELEICLKRTEDPIRRLNSGMISFIHSTHLYLLSSYYVPVTILDAGDIVVNNVGKDPALTMLAFSRGERMGLGGKITNKYRI